MKKSPEKNSTNKTLIIVCVVLVIIIIALVGFIGYTLGRGTTKRVESNYTETTKDKEVEIKDIDALTELSTEIDQLLSDDEATEYTISNIYGAYRFRYGVLKNTLTAENKQEIVLSTATWDKITDDKWKSFDKMKDIVDAMNTEDDDWYIKESHQLTADKVNKLSIDLFGEKISNPKEELGNCPLFLYDSVNKIYYRPSPQCGGTAGSAVYTYKSKFIQKNDEAYVYVSLAYGAFAEDEINSIAIYKDIDYPDDKLSFGTVTYKNKYTSENTIYDFNDFSLTESNYQEFSEYKFTFEQASNGNYYFTKVEQTK